MMKAITSSGTLLLIAGLIAAGPALLLLSLHPTRGSLRLQRYLRSAVLLLHVAAIAAASVPAPESRPRGNATQDGAAEAIVEASLQSESAQAPSAGPRTPRAGAPTAQPASGTAALGIRQPSTEERVAAASGEKWPSAAPSKAKTASAPLFGVLDPRSIGYRIIRRRASGVLRTAGALSLIGSLFTAALMITTAVRDRRRERLLEADSRNWRIGRTRIFAAQVSSAYSTGVLRPRIYIPAEQLGERSLRRAIVAHELAHVRSTDGARLLLDLLFAALFWWSPAIRLATERGRLLREMAADQAAASRLSGSHFCNALVRVASLSQASHRSSLAASMAAGATEGRLRRLLGKPDRRGRGARWAAAVAVAIAASALVTACATMVPDATYAGLPLERYWIVDYAHDGVSHVSRYYEAEGDLAYRVEAIFNEATGTISKQIIDAEGTTISSTTVEYEPELHHIDNDGRSGKQDRLPVEHLYPVHLLDSHSREYSLTTPEGEILRVTNYGYDDDERFSQPFEYRHLNSLVIEYDRHGRPLHVVSRTVDGDLIGSQTEYRYGADGNRVAVERDPSGSVISRSTAIYDAHGRTVESHFERGWRDRSVTRFEYRGNRIIGSRYQTTFREEASSQPRFPSVLDSYGRFVPEWVTIYRDETSGFAVELHERHLGVATDDELEWRVRDLLIEIAAHLDTFEETYRAVTAERGPFRGSVQMEFTARGELYVRPATEHAGAIGVLADRLMYTAYTWQMSTPLFRNAPVLKLTIPIELDDRNATIHAGIPAPTQIDIGTLLQLDPESLIDPSRLGLTIGMRVLPNGAIVDPYLRSWRGAEPRPAEEQAIVETLWGQMLPETGFEEPKTLVLLLSRRDHVTATVSAPEPAVERWLLKRIPD